MNDTTTLELKVPEDFKVELPLFNATHSCSNCRFNDGLVYTSNPLKYKCTFDNEYYKGYHICHLDLVPVTKCKKCKHFLTVEEGREDLEYKDLPWGFCISAGYNGFCTAIEKWRKNEDFCSEGKTKE